MGTRIREGRKFSQGEELLRTMADAVGGANFENAGDKNRSKDKREHETGEVVDGRKEMRDEDTNMGNNGEKTKEKEENRKEIAWK